MLTATPTRTENSPHSRIRSTNRGSTTLSVVVPLFNESENLPELYDRLTESLEHLGVAYELLFVNDGSTDDTATQLDELCDRDENVAVIHFSRNFGHQPAITAGLEHARADAVIVMDGDLQDPPEVIPALVERWREGYDVAYAVRTRRKENLVRRGGYYFFYRLLKTVSNVTIPLDAGDFCLMDRRVVRALNRMPERDRFIRGLRSYVGFRQIGVPYDRPARTEGDSKYTFRKLFGLAMSGLFSTSDFPVRILGLAASLTLAVTMFTGVGALIWSIATGLAPATWLVVLVVAFGLAGGQFAGLTLLASYMARLLAEVRQRPIYVVREIRGSRSTSHPSHPLAHGGMVSV